MNKKITKKTKIIVLISLAVVISLMAIIAFAVTGVFNRRLEIQIITEKETVKTGEIQKVLIRNVYSNPNDGNSEKIRVHLRTIDDKPNTTVKLLNVTEGKIDYVCENNKDLTVSVYLNEEKGQNGQVIDSYLEYTLPPGSSTDMELEFIVEAGENGLIESLKLEPEVVDGKKAENDKIDENVIINWKAEYLWDNFKSNVSNSNLVFNNAGINESKIQYTYSLDNKMTEKNGSIYTQNIEIDNELILPKGITLPQGIKQSEENKNQLINNKGEIVYEINIKDCKYNVKELVTEKNEEGLDTIKYKVIIENEDIEDYKFNPMDKVEVNLTLNKLNVNTNNLEEQNIRTETDLIITSVSKEGQSVPITTYEANSDTIVNFARSGDISLSKDIISIYKPKNAKATEMVKVKDSTVRPNYNISYQIKISNNSGLDIQNANVIDLLPAVLTLNLDPLLISSQRGILNDESDYSYSKEEKEDNSHELKFEIYEIKNTETIIMTYETKVNGNYFTPGEKIINKVTMGNKETEKSVDADSATEITIKKEIVSRTLKTIAGKTLKIYKDLEKNEIKYTGDYGRYFGTENPSQEDLEKALSCVGAGDIIEYVITLDNPTASDCYGKVSDYPPFAYRPPNMNFPNETPWYSSTFGNFVKGWKYYINGYETYYNETNTTITDEETVNEFFKNYRTYDYRALMEKALNNGRHEPILYTNQAQWTFSDTTTNNEYIEENEKRIKAYTTYRQTVILQIPGDSTSDPALNINDEYQRLFSVNSYFSNYGEKNVFNTIAEFTPTTNSGNKNGDYLHSELIKHHLEQQIYINTGTLATSDSTNGTFNVICETKKQEEIDATQYNDNARTFKNGDAIINYVYIYNDSSERMKIDDYDIRIDIPQGFEYLGFVTPISSTSTEQGTIRTFGNLKAYVQEDNYYREKNIWVSNLRSGSPIYKYNNAVFPTEYDQFTNMDRKNSGISFYKKSEGSSVSRGSYVNITSNGSIEPYTGIVFMYASKANLYDDELYEKTNSGATFSVQLVHNGKEAFKTIYAKQISPVVKAGDYYIGYKSQNRKYVYNDGECLGIQKSDPESKYKYMTRYKRNRDYRRIFK